MEWEKIGSNFVWNDGRGILFSENESGFFIPKTNSYMLPIDTKNLEIRYKVLLPTPDVEADSLLKSFPENGCYTPTYRYQMRVESIICGLLEKTMNAENLKLPKSPKSPKKGGEG